MRSAVESPRVSVVLVTFNRGHVVGETVACILNQSFTDFELIVCDDASTDNTAEIVKAHAASDVRVRYVRAERNRGMPGNLNAGLRLARGEYVAILHDGDLYRSDLLEKWSAVLDRHPSVGFVFNQYQTWARLESEPLSEVTPGHVMLEQLFFRRWRLSSPVWGTVMGRRRIYEEFGYFDERFGFLSDVAMWMRIAESWDVGYVPEPLITLPSREDVPRLFTLTFKRSQQTLEAMFHEAVDRHWRHDVVRRTVAKLRLMIYGGLCRMECRALAVRRAVKRAIAEKRA